MIDPFLKWAGGKRWLVEQYADLFPKFTGQYFEPFLGGGSVYFHLSPARAWLADSNEELINSYSCVQHHPNEIARALLNLQSRHSERTYYEMRGSRPRNAISRAVRFLYLNRTCFNGLYRVNLAGRFNVPMGSKTQVAYPAGYLEAVAKHLHNTILQATDFEQTIECAAEGDFVFADPPYTVSHNNNNFVKYNARLFGWSDQLRLAAAIKRAAARGAYIMLSNADHQCVRELYKGFGYHFRVRRSSVLAAESSHRRSTTELVVTTYKAG